MTKISVELTLFYTETQQAIGKWTLAEREGITCNVAPYGERKSMDKL